MHYLIIGNGIAGVNAAEAIRELDQRGAITMVGDETYPPYSRPMICHVLEGSQPHSNLPIRSKRFYDQLDITPALGHRVELLDVAQQRVRLTDATTIDFDRLVIASGADPRPIAAEGLDLDHIYYMRTQAHAKKHVEALSSAKQALVLGGGLVGFKAAYGLLKRGLRVTMLITSSYPLSMQVDAIAGKMILDEMLRHGLDVRVGVSVTTFQGNGTVAAAQTDTGEELPCDLVIIGKGVLPAISFVPRQEIEVDLGIVVDAHMETSAASIFAAGDAAEALDIARQRPWVNAIWPEAAAQGRIAGYNMAGRTVSYCGSLSRNVMRVFDLDVMTLGYAAPENEAHYHVVRATDPQHNLYRSLVFQKDRLVGAILINRIEQGGILRSLIERQVSVTVAPEILMSPSFNFGQLLP